MSFETNALILAFEKGYRVSIDGTHVVSPIGRRLNGSFRDKNSKKKYRTFCIKSEGSPRNVAFSRLQAYQKFGTMILDPSMEARHLNENSEDNSYDNIGIGTGSQNQMDQPEEVRKAHALHAASFRRRFSSEQIEDMKKMKLEGICLRLIGEKYGIGKGHVSDIINEKIYSRQPASSVLTIIDTI